MARMPNTGPMQFSQLGSVFGGTQPHSMSEYYKGGPYVLNSPGSPNVPTSGPISMSQFRNAGNATLTVDHPDWNDELFRPEPAPPTQDMGVIFTFSGINLNSGTFTLLSGGGMTMDYPWSGDYKQVRFFTTVSRGATNSASYRFDADNGLSQVITMSMSYFTDL